MGVKESEKVRENKYFRVNYMHFAAKEWKKSNVYTIKAQRVTGAIIPALKHRIPSELRSYACLGESSTRMGDLLGSPRVAPLLSAALVETVLLHPFFLFFPRLQHSARAPSLRISRRYDAIGGAPH